MTKTPNIEVWVWTCLSAALIALRVYLGFVPNTGNDAFQYFSVAENALAGHIGTPRSFISMRRGRSA